MEDTLVNIKVKEKVCNRCLVTKSLKNFHKHKLGRYGLNPVCKSCRVADRHKVYTNNKEYYAKQTLTYQRNNPDRRRGYYYKFHYGMSLETFNKILQTQDYKCKICGSSDSGATTKSNLSVDHNHETGKIRGLLCDSCNKALGCIKDNIGTLHNMITYLQEND